MKLVFKQMQYRFTVIYETLSSLVIEHLLSIAEEMNVPVFIDISLEDQAEELRRFFKSQVFLVHTILLNDIDKA